MPVTQDSLLETLTQCPALTNMTVVRLKFQELQHVKRHDSVSLPVLRQITVELQDSASLFLRISLPPTCLVELKTGADSFSAQLPTDLSSFHPISCADAVEFRHYCLDERLPNVFETSAIGARLLQMGADNPTYSDTERTFTFLATELVGMLAPFRSIRSFTLRTPFGRLGHDGTEHAWRLLLDSLPQLTRLQLSERSDGNMFSALGDADASGAFVCAALQEVDIRWMYHFDFAPFVARHLLDPSWTPPPRPRTGPEALHASCEAIAEIIARRAPQVSALQTLTFNVVPHPSLREKGAEPWNEAMAEEEERLHARLQDLVGAVMVRFLDADG